MLSRSSLTAALFVALWTASTPAVSHAQVVNGSFEDPVVAGNFSTISSGLTGWTIVGPGLPTIDVINAYWPAADGNQSIDLVGDSGVGTGIEQIVSTVNGYTYELTFFYANNVDTAFAEGIVSVVGASALVNNVHVIHAGSSVGAMNYIQFTQTFVADSDSVVLRFEHFDSTNPGAGGLALDGVALTAVPEPSTWMLLGSLLGSAAWIRRVRRRNRAANTAG